MAIYSNSKLVANVLPGLAHRTLAGPEHGLKDLEIWSQSIDAQAATPPHRHDCEEVVMVVEGEGKLAMSGEEAHFAAGDTVIIPRNEIHQIFNTGQSALRLFAVFSMAPVRAEFPDGTRIDLPWQQAASESQGGGFHA